MQIARPLPLPAARRGRLLREHQLAGGLPRFGRIRRLAGQQLVQDRAQSIHVNGQPPQFRILIKRSLLLGRCKLLAGPVGQIGQPRCHFCRRVLRSELPLQQIGRALVDR